MSGILIYNKTGERFNDEGEYNDYPHSPASLATNPFYIAATTPAVSPLVGSAYASAETLNKVFQFPSDATQTFYDARKPIDCGSMKILVNNISHLVYQKCRTIAVATGPGAINFIGSDLNATVTLGGVLYPLVATDVGRPAIGVIPVSLEYTTIGWSIYSSRRIGPIPVMVDRKAEYNNQPIAAGPTVIAPSISNNSFLFRKMILCVEGYCPADEYVSLYTCVTTDGNNPRQPNTQLVTLDASECAWYEYYDAGTGALLQSGFSSVISATGGTVPATAYATAIPVQAAESYPFLGVQTPVPSDNYRYRIFIPVNCTSQIIIDNASAVGVDYIEAYVHLGWKVPNGSCEVKSISLLECRDPGSAILS